METGITEIFQKLKENLVQWYKSDLISLVYYPSSEQDDPTYFFLLIVKNKQNHSGIHFWMEYYQRIESHWDTYWSNLQPNSKIPILSITLRTKDSCEDHQLISMDPNDPFSILFDTEDFYKNIHSNIVVQSTSGNFNPEGDIFWI